MATSGRQAGSGGGRAEGVFLAGRLLIAMPGISDPRFERAVILVCGHDERHALGLRLNEPLEGVSAADLFGRLGVAGLGARDDLIVLSGGPVERERGFVLHSEDFSARDSTVPVADGVRLTATRDVLEAIADPLRRPRRAAFALGCAAWGAGQLEEELRENVWLTAESDEEIVFGEDHDGKWSRALAKIGVTPARLSAQVGRA